LAELNSMIQAEDDAGLNAFYKKYLPIIQDVIKKNEDLFKSNGANVIEENRKKGLTNIFNTDISLVLQIMNAQDRAQAIDAEFKPLTAGRLDSLKQEFTNASIYSTLVTLNASIIKKIEDNKIKTGYSANEVPKTAADSVFTAITNKYKGKIIYVDFWATWCGPCRMGIESIAPLKEELKNENIVFLYITNPSSPIGTYNNMIPDIKGEHYRVNNDEWNVLAGKFKISGIPHYALVNKKGVVIDDALPHMENGELKTKLIALAKE
jgi:thiol-disulfide isomerase/thioredoxin